MLSYIYVNMFFPLDYIMPCKHSQWNESSLISLLREHRHKGSESWRVFKDLFLVQ